MGNFLSRMRARFQRFMVGRYGSDQLSRFMLLVAVIFIFLSYLFNGAWFLSLIVWVLLILVNLRMFSRNIQARYNENTRYLLAKQKVKDFFRGKRNGSSGSASGSSSSGGAYRSDAEHRIFRCPKCEQRVRVPRGKGKIEITCPRCGHHFTKRS